MSVAQYNGMVDHLTQYAVLSLEEPTTVLPLDAHKKLLPSLGLGVDVQHSPALLAQVN